MTRRTWIVLLTGALVVATSSPAVAQRADAVAVGTPANPPAQSDTDAGASNEKIDQLIRDLDANRFSQRQDASRKLKALGQPAIEQLIEAVLGESREASSRAFEILKEHFQQGEGKLREAAEGALKKLAESDKAPVARNAKEVLEPEPPQPPQNVVQLGGQIQIQVRAAGAQQIQVRNVNGVKDIKVNEAGRSIRIHEDPNKGIRVEVTETKDGKAEKKKYEAKDAAQLKKKHPEAYKIYEKYNRGGGGIQIQARGGQLPAIQLRQVGVPNRGARRLVDPAPIAEQVQKAAEQLKQAHAELKKLNAESPEHQEKLKKASDELREVQKQLQEALKKMK